jgi:hypothetical protein
MILMGSQSGYIVTVRRKKGKMDFDREWTQFALEAEIDAFGVRGICTAHNDLRLEVERLKERENKWQEAEASVCPEDFGVVEYIGSLKRKLALAEKVIDEVDRLYCCVGEINNHYDKALAKLDTKERGV